MEHRARDGAGGWAFRAHVLTLRALVLGLLAGLGSAGCRDQACFSWTLPEGECPPQEEALQYFVPPGCYGSVESVDSDGDYIVSEDDLIAGDLCCYSVTESSEPYAFCDDGSGF